MSNTIICSLCGAPGTNKGSCPLTLLNKNTHPKGRVFLKQVALHSCELWLNKDAKNKKIGGSRDKGPNRKFKIDVTMDTPKVLGVFDLNDHNLEAPTWRKNPKPYKTINPSLCASDVVKWYKYVMGLKGGPYHYSSFIGNFDIKHIKGNVFEVSYTLLDYLVDPKTGKAYPDTVKPWQVADPDYKYLHPLGCQGTKYHVYATVHGSKSKIPPRQVRSEDPFYRGPYNEPAKLWK